MKESVKVLKRNPSIELLRILMMMQIIFLHVADYGDYSDVAQQMEGKVELTYWVIWLMCRCPVFMFVIITGYFMSTRKEPRQTYQMLPANALLLYHNSSGIHDHQEGAASDRFHSESIYPISIQDLVLHDTVPADTAYIAISESNGGRSHKKTVSVSNWNLLLHVLHMAANQHDRTFRGNHRNTKNTFHPGRKESV